MTYAVKREKSKYAINSWSAWRKKKNAAINAWFLKRQRKKRNSAINAWFAKRQQGNDVNIDDSSSDTLTHNADDITASPSMKLDRMPNHSSGIADGQREAKPPPSSSSFIKRVSSVVIC